MFALSHQISPPQNHKHSHNSCGVHIYIPDNYAHHNVNVAAYGWWYIHGEVPGGVQNN